MDSIASNLRQAIDRALPLLEGISEQDSRRRPAPGKWSPKEIIGHLIDSASNNHQRFVRAQFQNDLVFAGYEQNAWVIVQDYQQAPWKALIALWHSFNTHLVHLIDRAPEEQKSRPRHPHNLHQLAWRAVPAHQPVTLGYFMQDYVGHLEHHLRQILKG